MLIAQLGLKLILMPLNTIFEQARGYCRENQRLLAVIKADAYGHGAVRLGLALQSWGVADFAVATISEAIALREAGLLGSLLVLGGCFPGQEDAFIDYRFAAGTT